jgi:hypothetical protein
MVTGFFMVRITWETGIYDAIPAISQRDAASMLLKRRRILWDYSGRCLLLRFIFEARGSEISERTRVALAQKKVQGARLGNRTNLPEAQAKGTAAVQEAADAFAANALPIVRQI